MADEKDLVLPISRPYAGKHPGGACRYNRAHSDGFGPAHRVRQQQEAFEMTIKRSVLAAIGAALLTGNGSVMAGLGDRADLTRLRTQPDQEPAWLVERADNSTMRLSVLSQTRYMYSVRQSGFTSSDDIQTNGFAMPRTRVALDGTIVSSQLSYRVSFDFGDAELSRGRGNGAFLPGSTGSGRLLDAFAQYNFSGRQEGYYLKAGQFQSIVMTEEAVDSGRQLAIDRSLSSELFGPGYTQGVALGRVLSDYAWEVSINDGGRMFLSRETDNTAFNDQDESDLGFSGRFDWKIKGDWDQFSDFTSWRGSNEAAKLGAGFQYQFKGQYNPGNINIPLFPGPVDSGQFVTWSLDYQYEDDGWNFFAAYTGMWVDFEFVDGGVLSTLGSLHNSVVLQGGWFITEDTEWFARLETFWIDKDYRNAFGLPNGFIHRIATVGVTQYLLPESHAAKLQADVSFAFDSLTLLTVGTTSILLPDPSVTGFQGLTDEELVFRLQLQLEF